MKKWQKDRVAYAWARTLLPGHIRDLKHRYKKSDNEYVQITLDIEISQAEKDLDIIAEEYKKITNEEI